MIPRLPIIGRFLSCFARTGMVSAAVLFAFLTTTLSLWAADPPGATKPVDYLREVRPILAAKCYACHGPDEKTRKEDLRLDVRESAVKKAIHPGDAAKSPLIERITSTDPEQKMPPPASKKPALTAGETETLRRWIAEGAKFDLHWAYVKPVRVEPPVAADPEWSQSTIDRFIAAGQARVGLGHAAAADKRTLVRRLYFDLVGLPPKPEEVEAFVANNSPAAYEQLVDRLLASERFGERMALVWLDLVRYADTGGYHSDNHRDIWLYRDYVIKSFNAGKPYDRFCLEQLAGDLLPDANRDTRIASGYNRLLMTTEEGGAQAKEYTAKYQADRVRNTSVVWLGSTMGCCECHNHKYDPFTTRDFYSLAAFFADVQETAVGRQGQTPIPTPDQEARLKALDAQLAQLQTQFNQTTPELTAAQTAWEATLGGAVEWKNLKPSSAASQNGATLTVQDDASVLASGAHPDTDVFTLQFPLPDRAITAVRVEVLPHASLPQGGAGRAANGNFVLTELLVKSQAKPDAPPSDVKLQNASASFEQSASAEANPYKKWTAASAIDGDAKGPKPGWATLEEVKQPNHAAFETAADIAPSPGGALTVILQQNHGNGGHTLGHFRVSVASVPRPVSAAGAGLARNLRDVLAVPAAQRNDAQKKLLGDYYRTLAPQLKDVREKLAAVEAEKKNVSGQISQTLVTVSTSPRMVRLLPRGNWLDDSGEETKPAIPAFLGSLEVKDRRPTRLDLARWMVSPDNPLFARVFANRLWKIAFGQGICRSLEDFGGQGTLPTHPELLDWLAVEFRESGFNVKQLLKQMVMSRTYRMASTVTPEQRAKDPTNLYLSRQNRFRLDAELVRDNALSVSGLLVEKIGGPSVKPYQPPGYWSWLNFPTREWQNDKGEGQYRRGLYTYWQRTFLHPSLVAFDAPSREECTAERARSNTPLQALVLLNDPTYVEAARALAAQMIEKGGGDETARIQFAFRRALQRPGTADEIKILGELYRKHLAQFSSDKASAEQLGQVGDFRPAASLNPAEVAAYTSVARAILNLHETIVRN